MTEAKRIRDPERTRAAIVDAVVGLFVEGDYRPTSKAVAARAGVSPRSVFVHFTDLEALAEAATRHQAERWLAFAAPIDPALPLERRIDLLLGQRAQMYELMTPVRRGGLVRESGVERLRAVMAEGDRWFRGDMAVVFAAELAADPGARRPGGLTDSVEAAMSWAVWDHLRSRSGLSKTASQRAIKRTLVALLG